MKENMEFIINDEYANLTPQLPVDQLESLKSSIRESGVLQPIIINQKGVILDGHNRYRACCELGISCPHQIMDLKDDSLLEQLFIIETNCSRRQLSRFQRIEMQVRAEPIRSKLASERRSEALRRISGNTHSFDPSKSEDMSSVPNGTNDERGRVIDTCAKRACVSPNTYYRAREVIRSGNQEIVQKVRDGVLSINAAFKLVHQKSAKIKSECDHKITTIHQAVKENPVWVSKSGNQKIFKNDFMDTIQTIPESSISLMITIFPEDEPFHRKRCLSIMKLAKRALLQTGYVLIGCPFFDVGSVITLAKKSGLRFLWTYTLPRYGTVAQSSLIGRFRPLLLFSLGYRPIAYEYYLVANSLGIWREFEDETLRGSPIQREVHSLANLILILAPGGRLILDPFLTDSLTILTAIDRGNEFRGYLRSEKDLERIRGLITNSEIDI